MSIAKDEFQKSLARLEGLTKSQLFHTSGDSQPGTWAGSAPQDEDSMDDSIQENGTDYDGVKKALRQKVEASKALSKAEVAIIKGQNPYPSIKEKINKGEGLTGAERWALKGLGREVFKQFLTKGMENTAKKDGAAEENKSPRVVPDGAVAKKEDGKELPEADPGSGKSMGKSFAQAASDQPDLSKGIEVSPILHQLAVAIGHAFEGNTQAVQKSLQPVVVAVTNLEKSVGRFEQFMATQDEFNKSLGETVLGIGQHLAGAGEVAAVQGTQPVGPPKSQLRSIPSGGQQGITPIAKSFNGPGGLESGEQALAKSQIVNVMADMVKGGKLNPLEVVKFESTGELSPGVREAVLTFGQGGGR